MAAARSSEGALSRWRRRRRVMQETRHLAHEARRLVRKHGRSLRPAVAEELDGAVTELEATLREGGVSLGTLQDRADRLEGLLDRHLAFARKSALREYTESIGMAVLIALLLRAFVVEAFKIPSGSMIPSLEVGDHIFVNKFIHGLRIPLTDIKVVNFRPPKRGEIIVFVYPQDHSKDFIKRVVAVGGDTVALRQNHLIINGKPIKRRRLSGPCTYIDEEEGSDRWHPKRCLAYEEEQDGTRYRVIQDISSFPMDRPPERVPEGHVYVMGDNRDNSHDSRFWGTVEGRLIKGKAMVIWWSSGEPDGIRWTRFFNLVHAPPDTGPVAP